jgi:hypothetical protein
MDPFCKGCGAKVEWLPHRDGRTVAIDPEPTADGTLAFGPGMQLGPATAVSKRRYRYHITVCPNPEKARAKAPAQTCDREGCGRTDRHLHCFRCGETDHLANDCPEEV